MRDDRETGPSREDIVDQLYDSLTADDDVRLEKMDLGYKGLISQTVDKLLTFVADMNPLNPDLLEANDFETLKRVINERMRQTR